ncbi:hypothetical protein NL676_031909 [Syzygium grande]|nr:hypothetical protein NL676_031909 [Syzygium grande]
MIAAASNVFWQGGPAYGRKYRVSCTGAAVPGTPNPCTSRSVVVKIVNHCPRGCGGTIDLSKEAFATIPNPDAGKVEVTYFQYVQDIISRQSRKTFNLPNQSSRSRKRIVCSSERLWRGTLGELKME